MLHFQRRGIEIIQSMPNEVGVVLQFVNSRECKVFLVIYHK
jgi:hypothetical protein